MVLAVLAGLAAAGLWPFDAPAVDHRDGASVADLALGDRLTIGLIRTAVLAVVSYLVVSVPALVIDRRWIQAVATTGLTADADRRADRLEVLGAELAEIRKFLATKGDQPDGVSDLVEFLRAQARGAGTTSDDDG
jgi:hypothetical protein